jgi:DNA mismatch repair protein MutS2
MDRHAAIVLEFDAVREALRRRCASDLSRALADALKPSTDGDAIERALRQTDEARDALDAAERPPFGGLRDVVAALAEARARNRPLEPSELCDVSALLAGAEAMRAWCDGRRDKAPRLAEVADKAPDQRELRERLDRAVAPPSEIRDDASPKLKELRTRRKKLDLDLRELMDELVRSAKYRPYLMERTWSLRNGRHVLAVKAEHKGRVGGVLHDKSAGGSTVFVEPREAIGPANAASEAAVDENREVARILLELTRATFDDAERLQKTQAVVAWLDFAFAKAALSRDLDAAAPRRAEGFRLTLRRARHPLLVLRELETPSGRPIEPLSIELGGAVRLVVVTGPNTGGKTVVLKTIGLLQLMYQSGLHVPVSDGTELPVFADVFADIGDEQSIAQSLSTFSGHVRRIAEIVRAAGPSKLVLLDELGAGTDPAEGAALGEAVLEKLRTRGAVVAATTHLGGLKAYAYRHPEVVNACVDFDPATLEPTYRLSIGRPGESNALVIARRCGMPEDVVAAAETAIAPKRDATHELVDRLRDARVAAEDARRSAEDHLAEARAARAEAEARLAEAEAERGRLETEFDASARRQFAELEAALRPRLNALKNAPRALQDDVAAIERVLRDKATPPSLAARRREHLAELKKDDVVYVPKFGKLCRVKKMNRAEERLVVTVGVVTMEIGFDDVSFVPPPDAGTR